MAPSRQQQSPRNHFKPRRGRLQPSSTRDTCAGCGLTPEAGVGPALATEIHKQRKPTAQPQPCASWKAASAGLAGGDAGVAVSGSPVVVTGRQAPPPLNHRLRAALRITDASSKAPGLNPPPGLMQVSHGVSRGRDRPWSRRTRSPVLRLLHPREAPAPPGNATSLLLGPGPAHISAPAWVPGAYGV